MAGANIGGDLTVNGNFVNITTIQPAAAAISSFRCNVPHSAPHFNGRVTILNKIFDHFKAVKSAQLSGCWQKMVALVGLGGMGKTETACQFAKEYREIYPNVAWINAETKKSTLDSFLSLAKHLDIVPHQTKCADLNLVRKIYQHIDAHCQENVLLIFDNAIQLRSDENKNFGIIDFLPTEGLTSQRYPLVIITSQTHDWQMGIKTFLLEELSEEESLSFYRSSFKILSSECNESFKKLHSHLQGYPLAMNLAACNIEFDSMKHELNWLQNQIELYVQKFDTEDSSILTDKIHQNWPTKYEKTLSTVWQLSLKRLQADPNGKHALILLQAISFFHVPVTTHDLTRVFIECPYCPGTPDWMTYDRLKKSIRLLQRFHLVDYSVFRNFDYSDQLQALQSNAENNSQDVSMQFEEELKKAKSFWCEMRVHRLVQLVVRLDLDCSVVLEDILRFLAFWAKIYVRQLDVSAVEETFGRIRLSTRALSFVGLLAFQGNVAAQVMVVTRTPLKDPAATIWSILKPTTSMQTPNESLLKLLRAFIGFSKSEKSLTDKRCFAKMALEIIDNRTSDSGSFLQSCTKIEDIACELFSTSCSLTDVCSLPLLCENDHRSNAANYTVVLGDRIIESCKREPRIAQITEELKQYREFVNRGSRKWHQYKEELRKIFSTNESWKKIESEVSSCGLDQLKLKQVFLSIFVKIWSATENKNFTDCKRLGNAFGEMMLVVYKILKTRRSREILIPLMQSFEEILDETQEEQLLILQNAEENNNHAVIWICSTWMNFCIQQSCLNSNDLPNYFARVNIYAKMKEIPIDRIRYILASFSYWENLKETHETIYDKFMQMYSESPVEELKTLVTFCKEMSLALKTFGYRTDHAIN